MKDEEKMSNNTQDLSINSLKVFALLDRYVPKITAVSGKKLLFSSSRRQV